MTVSTTVRLAALALGAAGGVQDPEKARPTYALRLSIGPGSGWITKGQSIRDVETKRSARVKSTNKGEPRDQERSGDEHARQEIRSRVRVEFLEVEEGAVRAVRTTYEESRWKISIERDGSSVQKDEAFAASPVEGTEVTLRWGKEENEVAIKGGGFEEVKREDLEKGLRYRDLEPLVSFLLPKEPVKVGETWAIEGRALAQAFAHTLGDGEDEDRARKGLPKDNKVDLDFEGVLTAKLDQVAEEGGHSLATVTITGRPKEERSTERKGFESSATTTHAVRATLVFAVDLGLPRSLEWSDTARMKVTASGEKRVEEEQIGVSWTHDAESAVTFESKHEWEPLEGAASKPSAVEGARERKGG